MTKTGLDVLCQDTPLQKEFTGDVALLCHNASIDSNCNHAVYLFKQMFGSRFIKLFGPQHGFSTDVQDNMVETDHSIHPYFDIPVYSLYSETRIPSDEMLDGIGHLFVDLQDIGCRIYTYIYTLTLLLEKCQNRDIEIIVLDRPNPINGKDIEGNILNMEFASFVGRHPIPVRHGMTIGEVGLMHQKCWVKSSTNLRVIQMQGWARDMFYADTGLPWALPSPNIARPDSALTFPATVLFEGTMLSEGRGTTQSLEIVGHPSINPYALYETKLKDVWDQCRLKGVALRPITFLPTFQKHGNVPCGGFQIHITDRHRFTPWRVGQILLRELYHHMGSDFTWKQPPYEYEYDTSPIDLINGTDQLRQWVVNYGTIEELDLLEDHEEYLAHLEEIKLYN